MARDPKSVIGIKSMTGMDDCCSVIVVYLWHNKDPTMLCFMLSTVTETLWHLTKYTCLTHNKGELEAGGDCELSSVKGEKILYTCENVIQYFTCWIFLGSEQVIKRQLGFVQNTPLYTEQLKWCMQPLYLSCLVFLCVIINDLYIFTC